ncbi:SPFH domain-containing protein [Rhodohalobacter sulfatireducens]|uniref:Paraslipin n=1 Tax=Rhodohalobacter sulfatireducens TaxID=2911366 RepID=A0ABS9KF34_9BACT|nr:stomatin-like protein [Rhodohalobacter sulfatireducens]MCG2589466.1 paraslipin [Rhodohalobacter sulfatireducens]MDR9363744.1 stomatin-like protein [Balneolaceae bacterium]MDR9409087.1 stomatin-like protein [Balneolaceae bacterium]
MEILNTISQLLLAIFSVYVMFQFVRAIRLVPNQFNFIVERLGNYHKTLGAGFHALVPFIDKVVYKQDLREETIEVEPQECFTRDNVKVEVDGVIYISVMDPVNASYGVTDYRYAAVQLAQTTTRSVIGIMDLDQTFEERAKMSKEVVEVLSEMERPWGIKVHRYEIKNIMTPRTVQKAMERQMTAERDRRAVIAKSEGVKGANVNDAEGMRTQIINISEAEMQKRINEAEGTAQEIEAIAEATAKSIEQIADALSQPSGKEAMQLQLAEKYLDVLEGLGRDENDIILPKDITNYDALMEGLSLDKMVLGSDATGKKE